MYLEALVRATGVTGRFACGLQTDLSFVDVLISFSNTTNCESFLVVTVWRNQAPMSVTILPRNGPCGCFCYWNISSAGYSGSVGSSIPP
jgi:hypothetical protein